MDHGEATFAANPPSVAGPDAHVIQRCSLIQHDTLAVHRTCERDLVGVEVVET